MPLTPIGAAKQVEAIKVTAARLNDLLGNRINSADILLKTDDEMPARTDGGPSFGFWKAGLRQVWLWEEVDEYPVIKTLAHEAMHVLDDDWLTGPQRDDIRDLMDPKPQTWKDDFVMGKRKKYVALPYETFAVYGSKAIGDLGFARPAYRGLFVRTIHPTDMDKLRDILDRDDGPTGRGGDDVENIPVPPDTVDELQEQLAESDGKLTSARSKATDIRVALNQNNVPLAKAKASEIEAL